MSESSNIVVFACNWDGLSAVETAASRRLSYPASVKVIRVSCLSRVHAGLMLKAFELGADGVMLLGCEPANCHFKVDEEVVNQQFEKARGILKLMGFNEERLVLSRLPHGDAATFAKWVTDMAYEFERMPSR
jgi:F420-non-reducing hydrogenase iron-sulfur subunit